MLSIIKPTHLELTLTQKYENVNCILDSHYSPYTFIIVPWVQSHKVFRGMPQTKRHACLRQTALSCARVGSVISKFENIPTTNIGREIKIWYDIILHIMGYGMGPYNTFAPSINTTSSKVTSNKIRKAELLTN